MASHRRPKQPSRTRVTVLTTAAAAAVALSAQAANAAPSEKPTKDEVKAKVDKLYEEAEQATEKYNGAKEKQEKLQKEISTIQDNVARGQARPQRAARQPRSRWPPPSTAPAASTRRCSCFLSSNPDDYLDKASAARPAQRPAGRGAEEDPGEAARTRPAAHRGLRRSSRTSPTTRTELGKKKKEVQGKLAEAQKLLNTLTATEKAAARRRRAARASRAAGERVDLGDTPPASGRAAAAFAGRARASIGKPYVYGATGPASFDCSGLTSWAYAQAGVSIPRTSQAQANDGTRIYSQSRPQGRRPGDLLRRPAPRRPVRGQRPGAARPAHRHRRALRVDRATCPFQFGVRDLTAWPGPPDPRSDTAPPERANRGDEK